MVFVVDEFCTDTFSVSTVMPSSISSVIFATLTFNKAIFAIFVFIKDELVI
jgi:hypothetical protein